MGSIEGMRLFTHREREPNIEVFTSVEYLKTMTKMMLNKNRIR